MKKTINKLPGSRIEVLFEVPWVEFEKFLDKATAEIAKDLKVDGFRNNDKIPYYIVEQKVGAERILGRAAEVAAQQEYLQFVRENKIEAIGNAQVEVLKLAKGNPFSFKVIVDVLPEIELPDYRKLAKEMKRNEIEVKEEDIQNSLDYLQKSRAKLADLERPAAKGDFVEVEYKSPQIEGGKKYNDSFFLGKGKFAPGFEDNIEGMKAGEEKKFKFSFPQDYSKKELAGAKVDFELKLKKVQSVELPELNDEFARSLGNFKDLADLREKLEQGIKQEKEEGEKMRLRSGLLAKISQKVECELPETLVLLEEERLLREFKENITNSMKMSFEDYLKSINKTEEEVKGSFLTEAKNRVKDFLVLREIGEKEKVQVKEEDVINAVNEFLKNYPGVEKAEKELDLEKLKDYYRNAIFDEKVYEFLDSLIA